MKQTNLVNLQIVLLTCARKWLVTPISTIIAPVTETRKRHAFAIITSEVNQTFTARVGFCVVFVATATRCAGANRRSKGNLSTENKVKSRMSLNKA